MDGRMKKYRQLSPDRAKVWTEKSPKYQQQQPRLTNGKVPVVYYLSRNRQLEHPHFIEVPLSSSDGIYLRDVIERLNVLRGRGMASLYSWSCKRSYKNGFVWHDLCEDDLILPAHGNEYVLKGSELFDESDAGRFSPAANVRLSNQKLLPEPQSSRSQDDTSSSSSMNEKGIKNSQDDESPPPVQQSGSSAVSPQSSSADKSSSWNGSLSLTEYKIYKTEGLADASTQTDDNASKTRPPETCTRGVSTDDGSMEPENNEIHEVPVQPTNESAQLCRETVSPAPSSSSASSSGGRTDTLESLIRADINKLNSFRIIEGEEFRVPKTKLKPSNVLMQLISCGSISVKDHTFGLIPTYRPRFSHSKFPSPLFSTSLSLGDLDCLAENPRFTGLKLEDKEYFSGSLLETNMTKEPTLLKRSSSYNADRTNKELGDSVEDKEEKKAGTKCIPRSIKVSLNKQQARSESMKSPLSEGPRISSDRIGSSRTLTSDTSCGGSKRITEPSPGNRHSNRIDSFREEKDNVIKIEERLASGARVIIQSTGAFDNDEH
ncbi:protein SOSEKI 3 isoform X1 [Lycium barbarum]|uniref:protein SOSEKI 3 isoform X1 n=1 Tax=Lycium barbarum TaxID=112863 RepID=UPI00293F6D48|nr:protein SOSEKI 3 isoform X1 [Lycium barbarum]XP_060169660.1 protein SOSEKI 3 isoform X1 [Lycium barbarum]XP_060169661.1 protein SOSEKI 3 isoform X1 [Lycium barbarum]XP_060169662.1 protein SOSEKI 3 isoform X1 [Lycium barbarum]XP_060169663.1 protein SOSEKI 3 isoform X1 [Lycium barbarum]